MSSDGHQHSSQSSHHANFQFDVHLANDQIVNPDTNINTTDDSSEILEIMENCGNNYDEMPICQSYSDMEESLRAQHRQSPVVNWFLHFFYRRFIQLSIPIEESSQRSSEYENKVKILWKLNYLEASIYLEEGKNNDKFDNHPILFTKLPLYLISHNRFIYLLDLFCCWLLLWLALAEKPAVDRYHLSELIHASLELICLSIIGFILMLRFYWVGGINFFRHIRSTIKTIVLCLMLVETIIVLLRQDSHFRVTRSLRPIFLIDNFYFFGVRRVIRQTFQSLRSFFDMLALLFFFLIFFSISAFYLFSSIPNYNQFSTIGQSFLSLFILLTTANFPDIMMPAYQKNQLYALFFIAFLVINLYFLLNIMLAVVYSSFSQIEKEKFRKLFIHRRKACHQAFRTLVTEHNVHSMKFLHFNGLMEHLKPTSTQLERYLMYKALVMEVFTLDNIDNIDCLLKNQQSSSKQTPKSENFKSNKQQLKNDKLTLEKFYHIYEVLDLNWENIDKSSPWFESCCNRCIAMVLYKLRGFVLHRYFEYLSYGIIILATFYQFCAAIIGWDLKHVHNIFYISTSTKTICAIFILLYTLEVCLKMLIFGPSCFFTSGWNWFDFCITFLSLTTYIINQFFGTIIISVSVFSFRSLKLLELLRRNVSRYRDILGPFCLIIIKRFISVIMVVFIVYYFFAIIAMECFGQYSLKDCCLNTTLEPYYRSHGSTVSYYYLNNFQDLLTSYVTLFELMVVNNWQITMQAFVIVTGSKWSYLFFITFYILTLVVITIVVSFVLDTFNFHMEYKHRFGPDDSMSVQISIEIPLNQQEFACYQILDQYNNQHLSLCCRQSPRLYPFSVRIWNIFCTCKRQMINNDPVLINDDKVFNTEISSEVTNSSTKKEIIFRGKKIRDKFSYNLRMYQSELLKWIEQI